MTDLNILLGLWHENYLSEKAIITWAERAIRTLPEPDFDLIELALHGPSFCLNKPYTDFPRPSELSFVQHIAIRINSLDVDSEQELAVFLNWLIGAGVGDVIPSHPEVRLAYQLDHLVSDCDNLPLALDTLKENLASLLESSRPIFAKLAALIPEEQIMLSNPLAN